MLPAFRIWELILYFAQRYKDDASISDAARQFFLPRTWD
jgi:hypothetical protein